jgi:halocyanin-like protein
MTDGTDVSRRGFLRAATGATAAAGATAAGAGSAAGQTTLPDFGGYLAQANNGDAIEDLRGSSEVTVSVGAGSDGLAYDPAGIWIDPGTTVIWEWTGQGGGHNVIAMEDAAASFDSGAPVTEGTFEYTFSEDEAGISNYYCSPHQSLGMLGSVAVGEDVPTEEVGGGEEGPSGPAVPESAMTLGVATTVAMLATLGLAFFFLKYGGDYETPEE